MSMGERNKLSVMVKQTSNLGEGCIDEQQQYYCTVQVFTHETVSQSRIDENAKEYRCPYCEESFWECNAAKTHMASHFTHATKSKKTVAQKHSKIHTNDSFSCDLCEKGFRSSGILRRHLLRCHAAEKKFECEKCGLKCNRKSNLGRHILGVHLRVKRLTCNKPGEVFTATANYKRSVKRVERAKRFKPIHRVPRVPSVERLFECEICKRSFKTTRNLKIHRHVHSRKLSEICLYCHEKFRDQGDLKEHMRVRHRGLPVDVKGGPVSSRVCSVRLEAIGSLLLDQGVEEEQQQEVMQQWNECENWSITGQPSDDEFACSECTETFRSNSTLVEHFLKTNDTISSIKEQIISTPCLFCEDSFETAKELEHHLLHEHSMREN